MTEDPAPTRWMDRTETSVRRQLDREHRTDPSLIDDLRGEAEGAHHELAAVMFAIGFITGVATLLLCAWLWYGPGDDAPLEPHPIPTAVEVIDLGEPPESIKLFLQHSHPIVRPPRIVEPTR